VIIVLSKFNYNILSYILTEGHISVKHAILWCGLLVTTAIAEGAKPYKNLIVYAIEITGNRVTTDDLILREMSLKIGVTITPELLEKDRLRLSSLGIFNRVEIRIGEDLGRAVVIVEVSEPFYIYLFPIARYDIGRPEKAIWGVGGYHKNFRGRAARLSISGWTGFNKGMFVSHSDPWYSFGGGFSLSWLAYFADTELRAPSGIKYRRKRYRYGVNARRRVFDISYIGIGLNWEEQSSEAEFYTLSKSSRDRLIISTMSYETNKRDYIYYPTAGYLIRFTLEGSRMIDLKHAFYRESVDLRKYIKLGRFIIASRIWGESSQHELPYYRLIGLSRSNIRADGDFGMGGWMAIASNLELRMNLISKRYFSLDNVPFAGPYMHNMQFSTEGVMFIDAGLSRFNRENKDNDLRFWAWGCGLQFQLPYVETVHLLTAWRPENKLADPSYIAKVGVTF
jgi:outer membrane protein assembly factor BamA